MASDPSSGPVPEDPEPSTEAPPVPGEAGEGGGQGDPGPDEPFTPGFEDLRSAFFMGVLFVGTIALAMAMAQSLSGEVQPVFEDPEDPTNPLLYLGLVIAFTAGVLLVAKLGLQKIIQYAILGAVFLTMVIIYQPLLGLLVPLSTTALVVTSVLAAGILTVLLYYYPEWYIVDLAGVSVAAGATGWFGFSFGIVPALILLVAFAVYDAIAVYRTEHMLDLADDVMGLRLPIMLVVPKVRGYSFLEGERIRPDEEDDAPQEGEPSPAAEDEETGEDEAPPGPERDALFMGLGDIVIPGVLVVSSMMFLGNYPASVDQVLGLAPPLFVALTTLLGATVGFVGLMYGVLKGKPHAGLPALNGGALVGFLAPVLWLYGTAPLIPQF